MVNELLLEVIWLLAVEKGHFYRKVYDNTGVVLTSKVLFAHSTPLGTIRVPFRV
jgi:hypothetical protein